MNKEDQFGVFSNRTECVHYYILNELHKTRQPTGSWILKEVLDANNIVVSTSTVGRMLKMLDAKGYTELVGTEGRTITEAGIEYLSTMKERLQEEQLKNKMMSALQPQSIQELLELYKTRMLLESETARLAALHAKPDDLEMLAQSLKHHDHCMGNCMDPTGHALDFHGKIAEASNAKFLKATLELLFNEESKLESRILEIFRDRRDIYEMQHKLIAQAILNRDAEEAEYQMRVHMETMIEDLKNYINKVKSQ